MYNHNDLILLYAEQTTAIVWTTSGLVDKDLYTLFSLLLHSLSGT